VTRFDIVSLSIALAVYIIASASDCSMNKAFCRPRCAWLDAWYPGACAVCVCLRYKRCSLVKCALKFPHFLSKILFACISIHSSVAYERICNVDDFLCTVWLLTSLGTGAAILYMFEKVFYGAARVICLEHSLIICN
jgi:hypothetical protein